MTIGFAKIFNRDILYALQEIGLVHSSFQNFERFGRKIVFGNSLLGIFSVYALQEIGLVHSSFRNFERFN